MQRAVFWVFVHLVVRPSLWWVNAILAAHRWFVDHWHQPPRY